MLYPSSMFVYLYHVCPRNNPQPLHCGTHCTDLDRTAQVNSTSILWRIFFYQILPVIKGWKTSYFRARLSCNTMFLNLIYQNKVWKKAENHKTIKPHIPLCRSKQASSTHEELMKSWGPGIFPDYYECVPSPPLIGNWKQQ